MSTESYTLSELKEKRDNALERGRNILDIVPDGLDWHEYEDYHRNAFEVYYKWDRLYKQVQEFTLKDHDDLDKECLMTFSDFKECVEYGGFIDSDGSGSYSTSTSKADIDLSPSDITSGVYREDFTHVCWYNK